ncbi:MAG TPA: methylmalonyl-CoA mutase subunit beta, partial [Jatrophihabitantaceae bacterium]|nr:methylmalonyl-CoA mutase subunit beta [Jatrophihabitantaceae bacterium]
MTAPSDHSDPLSLAADFPSITRDDWRRLVGAVLRKSAVPGTAPAEIDPELALSSTTYDGIRLSPLYTAADVGSDAGLPGRPPFVRGTAPVATLGSATLGWDVRQRHLGTDPAVVNAAVLADLDNGVSSLWLAVGGPVGIPVERLGAALDGVYLDLAPIALDAGACTEPAAQALLDLAARRGAGADLAGTLGADPIGLRAASGAPADLPVLGRLAGLLDGRPGLRVATVDATVYHDAGGSDCDELAIAAAVGVAYLRALTDAGRSVEDALARIEFRYAVGADQFASIAKLRAARRIWDRIAELAGAAPASRGQRQHAVTSAAMMTRRDPWVNILRGTIACFAAAVGGAEAITVAPFDSAIGLPDDFGRRIARNTQSILHDESGLARVLDAAGGSFYVESLTEQLATVAWGMFTGIERDGGALAVLDSGALGGRLSASYQRRRSNVATRRDAITGVSEFALITEEPLIRTPMPAVAG